MDLTDALTMSAAGMAVQTARLRVIAENLANADTTGGRPGAAPYRRKVISFTDQLDQATGLPLVRVRQVAQDMSPFPEKYDPAHPAANAAGYVKLPNVNSFVESMDMREAERSYDANLAVLQVTRGMINQTLTLLK